MFRTSPEYLDVEAIAEQGGTINEVPVDTLTALAEQGFFASDLENLFN